MHRCLRIPEIQMQIFRYLSIETCNMLARTCTAFYEEAMNIVWADVTTFIPLMKCMRPEILTMEVTAHPWISSHKRHTLVSILVSAVRNERLVVVIMDLSQSFSREPSPEDWKQFLKHAHRVKEFYDKTTRAAETSCLSRPRFAYRLSPEAITTISRFLNNEAAQNADYCLFPRLRTLSVVGVVSDRWVPKYLPYLSHETLRTLKLRGSGETKDLNNDVHVGWSEIAPLMRCAWPRLHSVELYFRTLGDDSEGQHLEPRSQHLGPWIESLTHLQSLDASVALHPSLIPALFKLPLLRWLKLSLELCEQHLDQHHHAAIDAELLPLSRPCLLSLAMLDIRGYACTLGSITQLFQCLELSSKLRHVNVYLFRIPNTPHSATQLLALFEAISHIPSVTSLCIHIHGGTEGSNLVLSGTLFSALFSLRKLYSLQLGGDFDVTIEDKDLFNAAAAWPRLAEFQLPRYDSQSDPLEQSRVTLVGLQALYDGCRSLRKVSMNIGCVLPSVDHFIQPALPNLPPVQGRMDPEDVSRKLRQEFLRLHFALPDPEASPDPFYYDMEHARCMAMAIRVMLPKVDCLSSSCSANRFWTWDLAHFFNEYRRYIPDQAVVSALWEEMLQKRNASAAGRDYYDDGSEYSDDDD